MKKIEKQAYDNTSYVSHTRGRTLGIEDYNEFVKNKIFTVPLIGFDVTLDEINPLLKPHQKASVQWAIRGGRRALFEAFGLGKSFIQLEIIRIIVNKFGGKGLITLPLGVRQEFKRDAEALGTGEHPHVTDKQRKELKAWQSGHPERIPVVKFVRKDIQCKEDGIIYLTNYESVRDGKLDPSRFIATSLDEGSILRGFGGTKTFREFMRLYENIKYKFVATATPSPNEYIELLSYSAFLGIMDVSGAKTRFFKRDSTKADKLTILPHKDEEFWLWVASWALFVQKPSDLGFSDKGYDLPEMKVFWHEVRPEAEYDGEEKYGGQKRMFRNAAVDLSAASREKRDSLSIRINKMNEILSESPEDHFLIWHDLEAERHSIKKALPESVAVYGTMDLDVKEKAIIDFSDGKYKYLAAKPRMLGSGCNFQRHCHKAIFLGIGFKFNDFIQAVHRINRFLQTETVEIHLIYTEGEREIKKVLQRKWNDHKTMTEKMSKIIKKYGLSETNLANSLVRKLGVERVEVTGENYKLVNNDCVLETKLMAENSVGLILTSIPFSTQYEYSPNYNDFGHTDNNQHFWEQMDFLIPELMRVLQPGRVCAIHVKDRIIPGGMTGLGFQTVYPFHMDTVIHFTKNGFAYMGMKTIVTDVVRENNQTYRLGWTEQCKDGSKMGVGMPEYLLYFRKPPTDSTDAYADIPVIKSKEKYSRSRWQIDAHGFMRSSGDRMLKPEEMADLQHDTIFQMFKRFSLENVYNFEHHVKIGEELESKGRLPVTFMLLQPQSWSNEVWTDIVRMLTLNGAQSAKGKDMHLCLSRDSLVLTKERGYVPIQNVLVGEHSLTHKGRWRRILKVKMTGVQPVVTLRAQGVPSLTLTPEHKLWVKKTEYARSREYAERTHPKWIESQHSLGGYVNFKLPEVEIPKITDDLHWWIVGRWLADGHWEKRGAAIISCGKHEVDELSAILGERCGGVYDTHSAMQIRVLDPKGILKSTLRKCGKLAHGKRLPPEAFTLPIDQSAALLDGYLSGDGHYLEDRKRWALCCVNKELLLGFAVLAQRVYGTIPTIYKGRSARTSLIQGRMVQCKQEWIMSFDIPSDRRKNPFIKEDGAWKKVTSLEDAGEAETWCLKVEEDESFTAEGCIVKNCPMQFDLADRVIAQMSMEGETVYDPFSGLGTVPLRALKLGRKGIGVELAHSYFVDSLHYCRAMEYKMNMPSLFEIDELESTLVKAEDAI